jgi:hypothetical protein
MEIYSEVSRFKCIQIYTPFLYIDAWNVPHIHVMVQLDCVTAGLPHMEHA